MGFVKIFPLGHRIIKNIFNGPVEITEKIDGSQFSFGWIEDRLFCKSKNSDLVLERPEAQFRPAVEHVIKIQDKLHKDWIYFGETLKSPKHNVIKYDRVPTNHIALFGICDIQTGTYMNWSQMLIEADRLDIDVVSCLFEGKTTLEDALKLIDRISLLGGSNIEGIVVKNYTKDVMIGDVVFPIMCGKLVHELFKEKHSHLAYGNAAKKNSWEAYCEIFKHENRWRKAIRHLADDGKLLGDPKDIGSLVREIQNDIVDEERDEILEFMWKHFSPHLLRKSIQGFPEWYKEQITSGELDKILCKDG